MKIFDWLFGRRNVQKANVSDSGNVVTQVFNVSDPDQEAFKRAQAQVRSFHVDRKFTQAEVDKAAEDAARERDIAHMKERVLVLNIEKRIDKRPEHVRRAEWLNARERNSRN